MANSISQIEQIRQLSFAELDFLLTLYRQRSITNSAKKHNLTVPAASRLLKKLRETFGDPLFVRSNPHLIPTDRTHALVSQISDILGRMEQMAEVEDFNPATLRRTFRIAAVDNGILAVMRDLLKPFYEACPHSVLEFQQIDRDLFAKLEDGRLDAAILPDTRPIPLKVHGLKLYPLHYCLCVHEKHPLVNYYRKYGHLPIEEISKYRKVIVANQLSNESMIYHLDETNLAGESHQEVGLALPYFTTIPTVLAKTDLTVLLPDETAHILKTQYGARIAILPYGKLSDTFTYWTRLIWHERTHHDPVMQWFRGMFALYASKHHAPGCCVDKCSAEK